MKPFNLLEKAVKDAPRITFGVKYNPRTYYIIAFHEDSPGDYERFIESEDESTIKCYISLLDMKNLYLEEKRLYKNSKGVYIKLKRYGVTHLNKFIDPTKVNSPWIDLKEESPIDDTKEVQMASIVEGKMRAHWYGRNTIVRDLEEGVIKPTHWRYI